MDVSGVGGVAVPVMSSSGSLGAARSVNEVGNPLNLVAPASASGIGMGRMDQLNQLLSTFSTAEILMALMATSTHAPNHSHSNSGDVGMIQALGLALAGNSIGMHFSPAASANQFAQNALPSTSGMQVNVQG